METTRQTPEYKAPEPRRLQRFAIKAAGMLLREQTPHATLERLTRDAGGYQPRERFGVIEYQADVQPDIRMSLSDETSESRPQQRYQTAGDFHDAHGTSLESAVERTLAGARKEGPKARKVHVRTARRLAKYASKGVGARAHLVKK